MIDRREMMAHSYAPSSNDPPDIYVRWTWVKEMGIPWEKAGISDDDLPHLANLIGMKQTAESLKAKTKSKKTSGAPQRPTI